MSSDPTSELRLALEALKINTKIDQESATDEGAISPTGSVASDFTVVTSTSTSGDGVKLPTPTSTESGGAATPTSTISGRSGLTIVTSYSTSDDGILVTPTSSTGSGVDLSTPTSTTSSGVIVRTPSVTTEGRSETASTTGSESDPRQYVKPRYFDGFPGFVPNHQAPLRQEFARLAIHKNWTRTKPIYKVERIKCFSDEYQRLHSDMHENNLQVWQALCLEIAGLDEAPPSITQCKKILRKFHVNIFDYIDAKRAGTPVTPIYKNKREFVSYITKKGNFFPIKATKQNPSRSSILEFLNMY